MIANVTFNSAGQVDDVSTFFKSLDKELANKKVIAQDDDLFLFATKVVEPESNPESGKVEDKKIKSEPKPGEEAKNEKGPEF